VMQVPGIEGGQSVPTGWGWLAQSIQSLKNFSNLASFFARKNAF